MAAIITGAIVAAIALPIVIVAVVIRTIVRAAFGGTAIVDAAVAILSTIFAPVFATILAAIFATRRFIRFASIGRFTDAECRDEGRGREDYAHRQRGFDVHRNVLEMKLKDEAWRGGMPRLGTAA
jgi:hypothetical protein